MTALKEQFLALLKSFNVDDVKAQSLWQNLQQHYNQPHRHYHSFTHIEAMYQLFLAVKHYLKNPDSVLLAIVFHDVIYDPTKSDNEMQSALLLQQQLGSLLPIALIEQVSEFILATQKHHLSDPNNTDMAYFLDMDLAILGQDAEVYQDYAHAIRQEYCHIAEIVFKQGRTAVLQNFLQRKRLFFTDFFFAKYEPQARLNLQAEIQRLS